MCAVIVLFLSIFLCLFILAARHSMEQVACSKTPDQQLLTQEAHQFLVATGQQLVRYTSAQLQWLKLGFSEDGLSVMTSL